MGQIVSVLLDEAVLYGAMGQEPQSTLGLMAAARGMGWGDKMTYPCYEGTVLGDSQ